MSGVEQSGLYSDDKPREKCGVFGVYGDDDAAELTLEGLKKLQKRGQDSAGMAGYFGSSPMRHVGLGLVRDVFPDDDLHGLRLNNAGGHVRYSTSEGVSIKNAHPIVEQIGIDEYLFVEHNGTIADSRPLEGLLNRWGQSSEGLTDSGMVTRAIAYPLRRGAKLHEAFSEVAPYIPGVYTLLMHTPGEMAAARCEFGIKPGFKARRRGAFIISSETNALDDIGATDIEELVPGELLVMNANGETAYKFAEPKYRLCIFEPVYFANPQSRFYGRSVEDYRVGFGRELAAELPIDADMLIPLLKSGEFATEGYHQVSGIPIRPGLTINENIDRTFITANMDERIAKAEAKYIVHPEIVRGKHVVTIDDSEVNGITDMVTIRKLREAGARKITVLKASSVYRYPNHYGTNTSEQRGLVSFRRTVDQIREFIGADELGFLSLAGMKRSLGPLAELFDYSVYTGEYPVSIGDKIHEIEDLLVPA